MKQTLPFSDSQPAGTRGPGDTPGARSIAGSEQALQTSGYSLRLLERVLDASSEGVLITNAKGVIERVNPAFTAITGYEADEVIGQNPRILSSGQHDQAFYQKLWTRLRRDGQWQGEIWNRTRDGVTYPEWLSILAIVDESGQVTHYAAIFHDLTEMKRSEARIRHLAEFDELTRLANRRRFNERLAMAVRCADDRQRFAVLALDLDLFKRINDRFGHASGDEVLKQLAARIEGVIGKSATAARASGDEFLLILPDIDDATLTEQVDHLLRVISTPVLIHATEVRITASVGAAIYPDDATDADGLVRAAEAGLHQSKDEGRNGYRFFSPELHQKRQSRDLITAHLHPALDRGEFHLVYQPKLCLSTGQVVGVEALLRWISAELGSLPPDQFIPLAEDAGMISEIGAWVLDEAVRQARDWVAAGTPLPVAVNLSARQFQHDGLAAEVREVLARHQLAPEWFSVELTETSFLHSAEKTAETLLALREQGLGVAIDDFGTGYSSLSYIRTMSLDQLKIDRSFINNITDSDRDRQLVNAMIAMSQALGLNVVAEGVETPQQLAVLQQLGCDQAQGYLFCRPLPANELMTWRQQWITQMPGWVPVRGEL